MSLKRRYKIAENATIDDDGYSLVLHTTNPSGGTRSMGIMRPHVRGLPNTFAVCLSLAGDYYYVDDFGLLAKQWLSVATFASREEMLPQQPVGVMGPEGVEFTKSDGTVYWRASMDFRWWEVKSKREREQWSNDDERVKDYLCIAFQRLRESEKEFNKELEPTGWTLGKLMKRIGAWVPVEEIPVVDLMPD